MATLTATEFANKVCDYLSTRNGYWTSSPAILRHLGIPAVEHNTGRALLKRLRRLGLLEMRGTGRFDWKLAVTEWDRENPFKTKVERKGECKDCEAAACAIEEGNSFVSGVIVTGDTYRIKEQLKEHKGRWNIEKEGWFFAADNAAAIEWLKKEGCGGFAEQEEAETSEASEGFDNSEMNAEMARELAKLRREMKDLKQLVNTTVKTELTVKFQGKETKLEERTHPIFEQVLFHIACGDNVMLVGPKGCGKTYLAEQIAKALELEYGMLSLSGGVTESKLFGRSTPNITTGKSEFHAALFATMFEDGGVFLLDEVDAADPNVLLSINSGLANGVLPLDREEDPVVRRHKKFVCVAAANTWGNGADRQYVGRNQQDSAFTERFVQIAMDYDSNLELALCPEHTDMVEKLQKYRENMMTNRVERTISTRFITRAYKWMQAGKPFAYVEEMLFAGWKADEIRKTKGGY